MKKVIITLIALGSFVAVKAQVTSDTTSAGSSSYGTEKSSSSPSTQQQADLIKIRTSELPSLITQTLGSSDYQGWTVSNAYRTASNDQYKVEVKKGSETKTYWFDKNGNKIESGSKTGAEGTSGSGSGTSGTSGSGSGTSGSGTSGSGTSESGTGTSGSGSSGAGTSGSGTGTTTDR